MIKLPKEVNKIMKTIEDAKAEAFITGECVFDTLTGGAPYGWDIITSASAEQLRELFPEAEVLSEKLGILRMEFLEVKVDDDGTEYEDGFIIDVAPYRGASVEEEVARKDFTINAIADSPSRVVDPYGGRDDIRKKLIRTVGNAEETFKANPLKMMRAVRYAAQLGFDLHTDVYKAICENYHLLEQAQMTKVRDEFTEIMGAKYAGKGLNMILDTNLIKVILGEDVVNSLSKREKEEFTVLCENVDKTYQIPERRLGLFYTIIGKKKALASVEKLGFEGDTRVHLEDAIKEIAKFYFLNQKQEVKRYIYKHGWERYNYMANLEKAQRIVFDYYNETKIQSRMFMVEEIRTYGEPIFPDEMNIDGNDLLAEGICKTPEEAEKMLCMLVEELHMHPGKNTRKKLFAQARLYKRFKFLTYTRGQHWAR